MKKYWTGYWTFRNTRNNICRITGMSKLLVFATTIQIGRDNVTAFWLNPSAPSLANRWSCGILSNAFDKSVGITAKISLQRSRCKDPLARIFLIFQSLEPENVVQHDLFESRIDILRTITYSFIFCSSLHA